MAALHKKFLKIIDSDEPVYCNESLSKSLEKIANDHHKEASKELVEALEECLVSLKGMDKKYTLDKRRIEQAEKALENHLKTSNPH